MQHCCIYKIITIFDHRTEINTSMIPHTFDEWKDCIVNDCKINLTEEFARKRLLVYKHSQNPETLKFITLYGKEHLNNIIRWLQQIRH